MERSQHSPTSGNLRNTSHFLATGIWGQSFLLSTISQANLDDEKTKITI